MMTRYYLLVFFFLLFTIGGTSTFAADSGSSPDWQSSFDKVCAGTLNAMGLSIDELKALIERCATLDVEMAKFDSTRAKFYKKRLNLACNFYRVILDKKQLEKQFEDQLKLQLKLQSEKKAE